MMKKTLSLFMSIILILSAGSIQFAANAANGQVSLATVITDISGNALDVTANTATSKKLGDKIIIFGPSANSDGGDNVFVTDSYFGERALIVNRSITGDSEGNDTRFQISMGGINRGKLTFSFGLYLATDDCRMNLRLRSGSAYLSTVSLMNLGLNPYEWYTARITIDFNETGDNCKVEAIKSDGTVFGEEVFSCNFTGKSLDTMFIWGTPNSDTLPSGAPAELESELAFYAMKDLLIYHEQGIQKAEILSVGSDGEVAHGQKAVSFVISENIAALTREHVKVKNDGGQEMGASNISVTSDGTNYLVTAVMESNLSPWTNYTLEIGPGCYDGYKELSGGVLQDVSAITKPFHTSAAPFDMRAPVFTFDSAQEQLKAGTTIINTSGIAKDVTFLFVTRANDGRLKKITSKTFADFEAAHPGSDVDITAPANAGDVLKLFVIDGWTNRNALFEKYWEVNQLGESYAFSTNSAGVKTADPSLTLGEFDYDNKSVSININCAASDGANGILTVFKCGETPSESKHPAYIDYVVCHHDGTYSGNIKFSQNFEYGKYIAEFRAKGFSTLASEFTYYTPEEIKQNKRDAIISHALASQTAGELRMVVLGLDSADNIINDNFAVFAEDAGENKYNSLRNKDEVFTLLKKKLLTSTTYSQLLELFKESAAEQYNRENSSNTSLASNPSYSGGGGGGYGSVTNVISNTPSKETQTPADGQTISPFADMKGHWAEKYAADLAKRGIISGYNDNSFRGENTITRAELAKILVEAFGGLKSSKQSFDDVGSDKWYAPYVACAAEAGIVSGFDDNTFRPDDCIIRQDAILMLYRAMGNVKKLSEGYALFSDDMEISSYAQKATRCLGDIGIVNGNDKKELRPKDQITRAEVCALICRSLDYIQAH